MNKIKIFLPVFLLVVVGMLALSSCEKAEELNTTNEDQVLTRILDFKQKVETPNLEKNEEELSIEDAVWLIEATLNYKYCLYDEEAEIQATEKDSVSFEVPLYNNKISMAEVINIYGQLDQLNQQINEKEKTYLIDVFFLDDKLEVRIFYGEEIVQKSINTTLQIFTQEYYYTDAAILIEKAVNRKIRTTLPYGYITDVETIYNMGGTYDNPNSNDPNFCKYYMLREESGNYDVYGTWSQTLTVEEMNFYYSGIFTVSNFLKSDHNVSAEKRFLSCDLESWLMPNGDYYYPFGHEGDFNFGILHPISEPPAEL